MRDEFFYVYYKKYSWNADLEESIYNPWAAIPTS